MKEKQIRFEGWTSVFRSSTDYEADIVRDLLDSHGVPAVVFTQRDHSFNVNVGFLARVYVMVQDDRSDEAHEILEKAPPEGEELDRAAREANPDAPDAHTSDEDSLLDSAIEKIQFPGPAASPDNDPVA